MFNFFPFLSLLLCSLHAVLLNPSALYTWTPGFCHLVCVDVCCAVPQNLLHTWMGKSYILIILGRCAGGQSNQLDCGEPSRGHSWPLVYSLIAKLSLRITGGSSPETTGAAQYQVQSDCYTLCCRIVKNHCFKSRKLRPSLSRVFFFFYLLWRRTSNFLLVASYIRHFYFQVCEHVIYNNCLDYCSWLNYHQTSFSWICIVTGCMLSLD